MNPNLICEDFELDSQTSYLNRMVFWFSIYGYKHSNENQS